jgi:hypothetical protein
MCTKKAEMSPTSRLKMAPLLGYLLLAVHSVKFVHSEPDPDSAADDGPVITAIDLQVLFQ